MNKSTLDNKKHKNIVGTVVFVILPLIVVLWAIFLKGEHLEILLVFMAVLTVAPLFINFEKENHSSKELVIIATMLAISVASRFLFAPLPSFKPVTAVVIITGIYLGGKAGFVVGSLTPLISNMYFMQGMWTPLQMLVWGFIGLLAGVLSLKIANSKLKICIFGVLSGVAYSLIMDLWSTIWYDSFINIDRYFALVITSLPILITYAVSNVIFLLCLCKPIGKKLERIKVKYGIGEDMKNR